MKKNLLFMLLALIALSFTSCSDDDDGDSGVPGEVTITEIVTGNTVAYHAESKNAISFAWNLGNGETPSGQDVVGTYSFPGTYEITCTASGRDANTIGTKNVDVPEGDPEIFSVINVALSGYNDETGESDAIWVWSQGIANFTVGPMYGDSKEVGDTSFFDAVDESWWGADHQSQTSEDALDDEYSFALSTTMDYTNNFGEAFMVSWFWYIYHYSLETGVWEDVAYADYTAPASSWSVDVLDNMADTIAFTTSINGTDYDGAYILTVSNDARIGVASVTNEYQICKLANDTLVLRYENTVPSDMVPNDDMIENEITPGEAEWVYMRLVPKTTK
jgi:hypothetical protein